jgi:intracellular septation protein
MKQLFEFAPLLAFAIAYFFKDIFFASAVLIGVTVAVIVISLILKIKITKLQWGTHALVILMSGLTVVLHDPRFTLIKPTLVYFLAAIVFTISLLFFKKNLVKILFTQVLLPPETVWVRMCWEWIAMFVFMGVLNIVIAFSVAEKTWVLAKIGFAIFSAVFIGFQLFRNRAYLKAEQ